MLITADYQCLVLLLYYVKIYHVMVFVQMCSITYVPCNFEYNLLSMFV
jgi:hypothetical protein